jgi:hypothetical protein
MSHVLLPVACDHQQQQHSVYMDSSLYHFVHYYQNVDAILSELERPVTPKSGNSRAHFASRPNPILIMHRPEAFRPQQLILREQDRESAALTVNKSMFPSPSIVDRNEGARHPEPFEDDLLFSDTQPHWNKNSLFAPTTLVDCINMELHRKRSREDDDETSISQPLFVRMSRDNNNNDTTVFFPLLIKPMARRAIDVATTSEFYRKVAGSAAAAMDVDSSMDTATDRMMMMTTNAAAAPLMLMCG